MARKPTEAQQNLFYRVRDYLEGNPNPDKWLSMLYPAILSMKKDTAEQYSVSLAGYVPTVAQAYKDLNIDETTARELALLMLFRNNEYYEKNAEARATFEREREAILERFNPQEKERAYYISAQSEITNALSCISRTGGFMFPLDSRDAVAETGRGRSKIRYYFKNAADYGTLKPQDLKLLDYLLIEFSRTRQLSIRVPIKDFAEWSGRKYTESNVKELRNEIAESMNRLKGTGAKLIGKGRKNSTNYVTIYLCGGTAGVDPFRPVIMWNWNSDFIPELEKFQPYDYAAETAKLPNTGNAYYISRFFDLNYRRNEGKPNELSVSMAKLVEISRALPTIDEVKKMRGSAKAKIINPLFNDLDKIDRFVFTITDKDGNVREPETIVTYDDFIGCKVTAEFVDESIKPKHDERVKARKQKEKKARKG